MCLVLVIGTHPWIGAKELNFGITRRQTIGRAEGPNIRNIDVGLTNDRHTLASAIDPRRIERQEIEDGGDIARRKVVVAGSSGKVRLEASLAVQRFQTEIIETTNSGDQAVHRERYGRLPGIGEASTPVVIVLVKFGSKSPCHSSNRPMKANKLPPTRHRIHLEAFGLEPLHGFRDVIWACAEALGKLFRLQPLVVVGGTRRQLLAQKRLQIPGRAQHQEDVTQLLRLCNQSQVCLPQRFGVNKPL